MKKKVAIIILNYMNYKDTIECIDSILNQRITFVDIVIVDNASLNDSVKRLRSRYGEKDNIYLLKASSNGGYAKGNNIGVQYARFKLKADFVLVANNDTIFTRTDYIQKMLDSYKPGVGGIGTKIVSGKVYSNSLGQDYFQLGGIVLQLCNYLFEFLGMRVLQFFTNAKLMQQKRDRYLHGCALMLTPDFFEYFRGFYPHTFLFYEETILVIMLEKAGLSKVYITETEIYHKESESLAYNDKKKNARRYLQRSYPHVLLARLLPLKLLKLIC